MEKPSYLTKNGMKRIIESERKEFRDMPFVFQVVAIKQFDGSGKKIRQRLSLSDGISIVPSIVNIDVFEETKDLGMKENSVITIKNFKVSKVKGKSVIMLQEPFTVEGNCSQLGNPKGYEKLKPTDFTQNLNLCFKNNEENLSQNMSSSKKSVEEKKSAQEETKGGKEERKFGIDTLFEKRKYQDKGFVAIQNSEAIADEHSDYTPIAALNSMNPDWIIKARVIKKCAPRHWKSFRGEGDLMNIELKDEYGTCIQGTFFNKLIEDYKDQFHEGKVYSFRHGNVKSANPKFSSIKHPYAITFNSHTVITPLEDDGSIEMDNYSYSTLNEISSLEANKIVDTKGVVIEIQEMDEITMKSGMTKPLRRVIIADNSREYGLSIQITFWGEIAYKANFVKGEVIALKDAKVGKYNGISLNMSNECEVKRLKDEKKLRSWFASLDGIKGIHRLSEQHKKKFGQNEAGLKPQLVSDIQEKVYQDIENETNPNYVIEGMLTFIAKSDNMVYMACPDDKKKLHKDPIKNEFYCGRCNTVYTEPVPTFMVTAKLSDPSGPIFVSFYAEQAEQLFGGFTAEEFNHIQIHGTFHEVKAKIEEFLYKPVRVCVRAKQNDYGSSMNDVKYFGQKVHQYNVNAHNLNLLNTLKGYQEGMGE